MKQTFGKYLIGTAFTLCLMAAGCSSPEEQPLPSVILETDIGNYIDDVVALDMLYKYVDDCQITLAAECVNTDSPYAAAFLHLTNHWYGYPDIPIGQARQGISSNFDAPNYAETVCQMTDDQGLPLFQRPNFQSDSIPDAVALYRKTLAAQPDSSVILVSVGFSVNLINLLRSEADSISALTGKELIRQKVRLLSMMAGSFGAYPIAEYNVVKDIPSAQAIAREWPSPIVYTPYEVGAQVKYQATTVEQGLLWASHHPLKEAYEHYQAMPYDCEIWDAIATLYAVEPSETYFTLSPWGDVHVDDEGYTTFTPRTGGLRAYLSMTAEQASAALYRINQLTTRPAKR